MCCMPGGQSWIFFSVNVEGFEHAPSALVPHRLLFSAVSHQCHENIGMICIEYISSVISGDTGILTSSERQTQLHVLMRLSQHGAMLL